MTRLLAVAAAVAFLLLCAAGLAAYTATHTVLHAQDAYDYGDPDE